MVPKYLKIKKDMLSDINNSLFNPGDQFYSESEVIKKYNVSSITARRALQELVTEGYLYSIKGKGRFIPQRKLNQLVKFTDMEKYPDHPTTVEVLDISVVDDLDIKEKMNLPEDKILYRFERLRKSDGIPFFVQYSYISSDFIKTKDLKHPERFKSIYTKIKNDFNLNLSIAPSIEHYKITFPTPKHVADLLEIEENIPTSSVERLTFLEDDSVFEYIQSYKKWDYYYSKIEAI